MSNTSLIERMARVQKTQREVRSLMAGFNSKPENRLANATILSPHAKPLKRVAYLPPVRPRSR